MALQESGEMYLETILVLSMTNPEVRSIEISEKLGYSKPSVSRAMGLLRKEGYIIMHDDKTIHLTDIGRDIAEKIYDRHNTISRLLEGLGVGHEAAVEDACKIEHVISDESMEALKKHMQSESENA